MNIVVPTSGSLLVNRTRALQVLQAAGERPYRQAPFAQRPRCGQAAFAAGANQQRGAAGRQQRRVRQEILHGNMPNCRVGDQRGGALRHLLAGSNIDDVEALRCGDGGQRIRAYLDVAVVARQIPYVRACRRPALGAARGFDFQTGKVHEVEQQQFPIELPRYLQKDFQGEQCLQRAERTRHGPQHAGLRAIAHHAVGERIRPEATQAGVPRLRFVYLDLSLVLVHAGEDRRLSREHGGIVDQVLGAKIIAAVDDDVMAADQFERVVGVELGGVRFNLHAGIDGRDRGAGQISLRLAHIGERVNRLAMQITGIEHIGIDQPQETHARAREVLHDRTSKASQADDEDPCGRKLRLASGADFFEQNLPRIVGLHAAGNAQTVSRGLVAKR